MFSRNRLLNRGARATEQAADEAFDTMHGVDTAGVIPLSELEVSGDTWVFGNLYQAVLVSSLGFGLSLTVVECTSPTGVGVQNAGQRESSASRRAEQPVKQVK